MARPLLKARLKGDEIFIFFRFLCNALVKGDNLTFRSGILL